MKNPTITDCESPTVETSKGISTSTSGDSISVSECNGHDSPVKETASVQAGSIDNEVSVTTNCDDNVMDQESDERGQCQEDRDQDGVDDDPEKGSGDASSMNDGNLFGY